MIYPQLYELLKSIGVIYISDTAGTNAYTATVEDLDEIIEGLLFAIRFTNGNTGAATIDINGLGIKNIVRENNVALRTGEIVSNAAHLLLYDGTNFQLLSHSAKLTANQMNTALTGYTVGANTALATTDTLLTAFGKIQGQINARLTTAIKSIQSGTITGYSQYGSINNSVTISTVEKSKSIIIHENQMGFESVNISGALYSIPENVFITFHPTSFVILVTGSVPSQTTSRAYTINWKVIEFY